MIRRPPRPTLFPYPTLFRSHRHRRSAIQLDHRRWIGLRQYVVESNNLDPVRGGGAGCLGMHRRHGLGPDCWTLRSEEHTSELQSRLHLVCRLLLEKKKKGLDVEPYNDTLPSRRVRWDYFDLCILHEAGAPEVSIDLRLDGSVNDAPMIDSGENSSY